MIRAARPADYPAIQDIEQRAGQAFRTVGMDAIADDDPFSDAELDAYTASGRAWVSTDQADKPTAYVLVDIIDCMAHIEQVTVDPAHARKGLGALLIEHVDGWAREQRLDGLSLTTFVEVPWNAPYYERLGFRRLAPEQLDAGLKAVRSHEAELGLDRWPRTAMARPLAEPLEPLQP
ncbi:MAG TPA: GNAT family N-acetyltransferase [Gordonia sp. (in: high G+C Gram-positive bacteria)]|uniref:GNAT family N-acetyltransferase n=1 Tax=unclassified Gordonia (in: high G+C Gram-positive bacteria) TaxID=2657482 RepID=UPI000FA1172C|nr:MULTISPECIES: GNAT family N-acetyltransferase [unclassified Gordonia (in: high G+C Gram-positive bacteria)]RTL09674.1 MAG: GNAT family N-acetyltransferase [Acidimicrobiia bacterium]HNP58466.1 GNAT family N-acetyltransferase [Gordonia sp. (in: high G+C Gram-positive bacteria)]HRC51694.1 GNAT family N-acetyltransferase [Gordonia sp. (in: high G+C Gram-positive bacteria)]